MKRFAFFGLLFILLINTVGYSQKPKKTTTHEPRQTKVQPQVVKPQKGIKADLTILNISENSARIIYNEPDSIHKAIVISTSSDKVEIDTAGGVIAPPSRISLYNGTRLTDDATLLFKTFYGYLEFEVNALASQTHYYIQIYNLKKDKYEFVMQKDFTTLAKEPKIQAHGIVFNEVTESSISLQWINGNGEGRIVVVRKDEDPNYPEDGIVYTVVQDIYTQKPNLRESWVVYDGKGTNNELKLNNLKPGTYFFQIFEYNGDSTLRNYNLNFQNIEGNPRAKATAMKAPQLSPAKDITKYGFLLTWTQVDGASSYMLDIATDKDFKQKLENYDSIDLGLSNSYKLMDLEPNKLYFARVKAINRRGEGIYSNVIEVQTAE
ncbi:MAG TPA: fibronectin type III domain-containing protein [Candidatus Kapabacteria bacterium]|nr:fibronectin type III domain-containing protein [Candidatus Kapabacteria bacterium]